MQLKTSSFNIVLTGITVACAAIAVISQTSVQLSSSRNQETRTKNLTTIAQHVISQSCWEVEADQFTIGEPVIVKGLSPTSCFFNNKTNQYGYAAYLNGKLQITHVFSWKEVEAQKSTVLKGDKDG